MSYSVADIDLENVTMTDIISLSHWELGQGDFINNVRNKRFAGHSYDRFSYTSISLLIKDCQLFIKENNSFHTKCLIGMRIHDLKKIIKRNKGKT